MLLKAAARTGAGEAPWPAMTASAVRAPAAGYGLEDLPDLVLDRIFEELAADGLRALFAGVGSVSRRLRAAAWSASGAVFAEPVFKEDDPPEFILRAWKRLELWRHARRLCLSGLHQLPLCRLEQILESTAAPAALTHLSIAYLELAPVPQQPAGWRGPATFRSLPVQPRLVLLNASGVMLHACALRGLVAACAPNLQSLYLSGTLINTTAAESPAAVSGPGVPSSRPHPSSVLAPLQDITLPRLTALDVSHCVLEPEHLFAFLQRCPSLRHLFMANPREPRPSEEGDEESIITWTAFRSWPWEFSSLNFWSEATLRTFIDRLRCLHLETIACEDVFRDVCLALGTDLEGRRAGVDSEAIMDRVLAHFPTGAPCVGLDAVCMDGRSLLQLALHHGRFHLAQRILMLKRPLYRASRQHVQSAPLAWVAPYPMEPWTELRECGYRHPSDTMAIRRPRRYMFEGSGIQSRWYHSFAEMRQEKLQSLMFSLLNDESNSGLLDVLHALIADGADVLKPQFHQAAAAGGETGRLNALHTLFCGDWEMAAKEKAARDLLQKFPQLLLSPDTEASRLEFSGNNILHVAAADRRCPTRFVQLLLDLENRARGADTEVRNLRQQTPLLAAAEAKRWDVVEILRELGADDSACDREGRNVIHWATYHRRPDLIVRLLLSRPKARADASACAYSDRNLRESAMSTAAFWGHLDVVESLLVSGADPVQRNADGTTPLHGAIRGRHETVYWRLLADARVAADIDASDCDGCTPLCEALMLTTDNLELAKELLARGGNVKALMYNDRTLLHEAAFYGKDQAVAFLLEGKLLDVDVRDGKGRTPLLDAASVCYANWPAMQALIDAGADEAAADDEGQTALHLAAPWGRPGFEQVTRFRHLLARGKVDVDARDNKGRTPLFYARSIPIMQALLERGADAGMRDGEGKTALDAARSLQNADEDAVRFLECFV